MMINQCYRRIPGSSLTPGWSKKELRVLQQQQQKWVNERKKDLGKWLSPIDEAKKMR